MCLVLSNSFDLHLCSFLSKTKYILSFYLCIFFCLSQREKERILALYHKTFVQRVQNTQMTAKNIANYARDGKLYVSYLVLTNCCVRFKTIHNQTK